jgi:hypothetical protein
MFFVIVIVLVHGWYLRSFVICVLNKLITPTLVFIADHYRLFQSFVMNSTGRTPGSLADCSSMLIVIVLID